MHYQYKILQTKQSLTYKQFYEKILWLFVQSSEHEKKFKDKSILFGWYWIATNLLWCFYFVKFEVILREMEYREQVVQNQRQGKVDEYLQIPTYLDVERLCKESTIILTIILFIGFCFPFACFILGVISGKKEKNEKNQSICLKVKIMFAFSFILYLSIYITGAYSNHLFKLNLKFCFLIIKF
ncbi:unnamed protein product (macronuclear) [Paramecium tetraurelia]|uniref:Transmembrane protein n=1 Tax=Paramecium tetraurelia TaxID=5888 RepID=A0CM93_PARTE|nr:uncharacterized protein GSPATT00008389001 [Paramecium tetraurelia]CAK71910.1 unnamed protein product [Paramecium tetraurelia]|eukprot:XP_001439307.1 hypothetical protein (macronuclear) [Paramecium tetraurelia strain d4-2]